MQLCLDMYLLKKKFSTAPDSTWGRAANNREQQGGDQGHVLTETRDIHPL